MDMSCLILEMVRSRRACTVLKATALVGAWTQSFIDKDSLSCDTIRILLVFAFAVGGFEQYKS